MFATILEILFWFISYAIIGFVVFLLLSLWFGKDVVSMEDPQKTRLVSYITLQSLIWPTLPLVLLMAIFVVGSSKMVEAIGNKLIVRQSKKLAKKTSKEAEKVKKPKKPKKPITIQTEK